jgi:hypothetical protein
MKFTTRLQLVARSKIDGIISLLPLYAFRIWTVKCLISRPFRVHRPNCTRCLYIYQKYIGINMWIRREKKVHKRRN